MTACDNLPMSDENTFVCPMRGFRECVGGCCMWAIKFPNGRSACGVSQIAVDLERLTMLLAGSGALDEMAGCEQ